MTFGSAWTASFGAANEAAKKCRLAQSFGVARVEAARDFLIMCEFLDFSLALALQQQTFNGGCALVHNMVLHEYSCAAFLQFD